MAHTAMAAVQRTMGGEPSIEPVTISDPLPDEILVAIRGVGVCHTDMIMRDGALPVPQPVVLGHEGSGVVLAIGDKVTHLDVGDHVVLSFAHCGECPSCHEQAPAYCHNWFALNFFGCRSGGSTSLTDKRGAPIHSHIFGQSSFATHAVVPATNAVKVDEDLPLELLGPLGCGIQTGAGAVLRALQVRRASSIAVIGVGAVGLSAVMAAAIAEAQTVVALDINMTRVELALTIGATHGFRADAADIIDHAAAAGCPAGFDYIVDTTGIAAVCNGAIQALAPRGELALVGAYTPGDAINLDASFVMSGGRVVRGVVEGSASPAEFIPQLIAYYRAGLFPFNQLVEFFDFPDVANAIAAAECGRVIKPIIRMPL